MAAWAYAYCMRYTSVHGGRISISFHAFLRPFNYGSHCFRIDYRRFNAAVIGTHFHKCGYVFIFPINTENRNIIRNSYYLWTDFDGCDVPTSASHNLTEYEVKMGNNMGNLVTWCWIAVGIDVLWHVGCSEVKLINLFGVGNSIGNNLQMLYLGPLWTDFDEIWCSVMQCTSMHEAHICRRWPYFHWATSMTFLFKKSIHALFAPFHRVPRLSVVH